MFLRIVLSLFVITTIACKNTKDQKASTAVQSVTTAPAPASAPVTTNSKGDTPISLAQVPKASASRTAYLCTGPWKMGGAVSPSEETIQSTFPADEILFSNNGAVSFKKAGQPVGTGTWAYDDAKEILYLSSGIKKLNTSYKTMESGFRLVWLGNTDMNRTGDQIMWNCVR